MARYVGSMSAPEKRTVDFGYSDVPLEDKRGRVREVFDSVAGNYDLMNDAMSLGVHRAWKDMAITKLNPQPGELLLDIAGGTGDLARRWCRQAEAKRKRRGGEPATAVVCDINAEMVLAGVNFRKDYGLDLHRTVGNAEALPFADNSADALTIAFGIRNVTHREAALREFHRVLRPGGRLGVLEFSVPPGKALRGVYDLYSFGVIPRLGGLLAGDRDSYQYLVESIRKFPVPERFAAMLRDAGFARVRWDAYSGGICNLHMGWKV